MNEKKLFRIGEVTPHTYLDLEYAIRKLEENQKESMVFLGKVGVGIPKEKLGNQMCYHTFLWKSQGNWCILL